MNRFFLIAVLAALVAGAGCSKSEEKKAAEEAEALAKKMEEAFDRENPPEDVGEALEKLGDALSTAFGGDVETVGASALKDLLPEELKGYERVSANAEKTSAMGMRTSHAEAIFEDPNSMRTLTISITDIGGMSKLARMGMDWMSTEVDREDRDGHERTTTYKGHRAFEKYHDRAGSSAGEFSVFVADRFVVKVEGQQVDWDEITDAMKEIDIGDLNKMREVGVAQKN